jgi:hypothetical protein
VRPLLNGLLFRSSVVALLVLQFGVNIAYAGPVIRTVSTKGADSGDCVADACRTIQFAVDTAADGDTIQVLPGTYNELLRISVRNSLLIDGVRASETIIEGNHSFSQVRIEDSTNIEIRNLSIRNGGDRRFNEGGGVQALRSNAQLHNLILAENEAVNGGAVAVDVGSVVDIVNCLIIENDAANGAGAILVGLESSVNIESSTIANNSATFRSGGASNQGMLVVSNSIFWRNNLSQISTDVPGVTNVRFSDIQDGHDGVGNIDEDPMFGNGQAGSYRLDSSSSAIDAGTNAGAPATDLDGRARPLDGNRDGLRIVEWAPSNSEDVVTDELEHCLLAVLPLVREQQHPCPVLAMSRHLTTMSSTTAVRRSPAVKAAYVGFPEVSAASP